MPDKPTTEELANFLEGEAEIERDSRLFRRANNFEQAAARLRDLEAVRAAADAYMVEHDNPVPDYTLRRTLRDHLRATLKDTKANG